MPGRRPLGKRTATEAGLLVHSQGRLDRVKVPRAVDLVASPPKSRTGKILKRLMRECYWSGQEKRIH